MKGNDPTIHRSFLAAWNVANIAVLTVPLFAFTISRFFTKDYRQEFADANDDAAASYDEYGRYTGTSHWWQFQNTNYKNYDSYYDQYADQEEREYWVDEEPDAPTWWYVWGNDHTPHPGRGTVVFTYWYTLFLMVGNFFFGNRAMRTGNLLPFRFTLIFSANYCFLCCILLSAFGAVKVDGEDVEKTGWYGQVSALLFNSCLLNVFSTLWFSGWLSAKMKEAAIQKAERKQSEIFGIRSEYKRPKKTKKLLEMKAVPSETVYTPPDTTRQDSIPRDTTPSDTIPSDTTQMNTTPIDTTLMDTASLDTDPVDSTLDVATWETVEREEDYPRSTAEKKRWRLAKAYSVFKFRR